MTCIAGDQRAFLREGLKVCVHHQCFLLLLKGEAFLQAGCAYFPSRDLIFGDADHKGGRASPISALCG